MNEVLKSAISGKEREKEINRSIYLGKYINNVESSI